MINISTLNFFRLACVALLATCCCSSSGKVNAQTVSVLPASGPIYVRIQAIKVSDDDGKRAARITPAQVTQWVNFANRVFSVANVQFQFQPGRGDFVELKSTLLNNLTGVEDIDWTAQKKTGNAIAAKYSGKLVVFFRHGRGPGATGGGFSWWDYNFVAMPGFDDASHCGHPHTDALAHEFGHFLGLPHTFAGHYSTLAEAEEALQKAVNKAAVFDGDGFRDTPPDPLIRSLECDRTASIMLKGTRFNLPRNNIMSYYDERNTLSPQQSSRVRWILLTRLKHGMAMPSNAHALAPVEAEGLEIEPGSNWKVSMQPMTAFGPDCWSGNRQIFFPAHPKGSVTFSLPVTRTGFYRFDVYATLAPDFGRVQMFLDGKPLGTAIDSYAPIVVPSGRITLSSEQLVQGTHQLRVDMVGKNTDSINFGFGLDCIDLVPMKGGSTK